MQPLTRLRLAIARSFVAFLALTFVWATMIFGFKEVSVVGLIAETIVLFIALCFLMYTVVLIAGYDIIKDSVKRAVRG